MVWKKNIATPRRFERQDSIASRNPLGLSEAGAPKKSKTAASLDRVREANGTFGISRKHNEIANKELNGIRHRSNIPSPPRAIKPQTMEERELQALVELLVGRTAAVHFWKATTIPPITKGSLSELDISQIINNSKLRHDVNHDRELHFRPNLDGPRGQVKREAQKGYWEAITAELQLYQYAYNPCTTGPLLDDVRNCCQRRLPVMFSTIKDILKNLVPERDQKDVNEHLDVSMIMQEIENAVCDFITIAEWLAQLLKSHCAPMRDEMVDVMVAKISTGEPASVSAGLRDLFGVLEAMKLVGS